MSGWERVSSMWWCGVYKIDVCAYMWAWELVNSTWRRAFAVNRCCLSITYLADSNHSISDCRVAALRWMCVALLKLTIILTLMGTAKRKVATTPAYDTNSADINTADMAHSRLRTQQPLFSGFIFPDLLILSIDELWLDIGSLLRVSARQGGRSSMDAL